MNDYIINIICISFIVSILILLTKLFSKKIYSTYGAGVKHFIWLLLAIRLVIPVSFAGLADISWNIKPEQTTESTSEADDYIADGNVNTNEAESVENTIVNSEGGQEVQSDAFGNVIMPTVYEDDFYWLVELECIIFENIDSIMLFYCLGAALFLSVHLIIYKIAYEIIAKNAVEMPYEKYEFLLSKVAHTLNIKSKPQVFLSDKVSGPMLIGVLDPVICLPDTEYSDEELEAIFRHEMMHLKHKDLWVKRLYLLVNAIHWFNPLCYLMTAEAGKDMELYCDASVVKAYSKEQREGYNAILLKCLKSCESYKSKDKFFTTGYSGKVKDMKQRFLNNLDMNKKKNGVVVIILLMLVCILSVAFVSNVTLKKVNAEYEELGFDEIDNDEWFGPELMIDEDFSENEISFEDYSLMENEIQYIKTDKFEMGDDALYIEPEEKEDGNFAVTIHGLDGEGVVYAEQYLVPPTNEAFTKVPEIEIFCDYEPISDYGYVVNNYISESEKEGENADFFENQVAKGTENPLFEVSHWYVYDQGTFNVIFPDGMAPDLVDVEDYVLTKDGESKYSGHWREVIFRYASIDTENDVVQFSLSDHSALTFLESADSHKRPHLRGYKMRCYWVTDKGIQSVTYMFVVRTRNVEFDSIQ